MSLPSSLIRGSAALSDSGGKHENRRAMVDFVCAEPRRMRPLIRVIRSFFPDGGMMYCYTKDFWLAQKLQCC